MVSPRRSASMLLASLVLVSYWMISCVQSDKPTSFNHSLSYRISRDLSSSTTEQIAQVAVDSLSLVKDVIEKIDTKKLSAVMKGLANFAALAPGIGGLVSSVISLAFAFVPEKDPLREEFAEVNRKLDSLSIQISNLAVDVEWFNYVSVYSQDEVCILNAWKKFSEFREESQSVESKKDKLRLVQIFTKYYDSTNVQASVDKFYHYLTVNSSTSLSGNINDLLRKKFKCDVSGIGKYNIYFSSLLWKGMVLNQLYWNLTGVNPSVKEAQQAKMFKDVYEAQKSAVEFCLNNYEQYMKEDVVEITKALSPDNKQAVADQVKTALDKKYNWYNWVVLVYDTNQDDYYILFDMTKIPVDTITVAVGYTLKSEEKYKQEVTAAADKCFKGGKCQIKDKLHECTYTWLNYSDGKKYSIEFIEHAKVIHVIYGKNFAEVPEPFHEVECRWGHSTSKMFMHYSRMLPVCDNTCKNGGKCKRLLSSNDWLCECPDAYHGDKCEHKQKGQHNGRNPASYATKLQLQMCFVGNIITGWIMFRCIMS